MKLKRFLLAPVLLVMVLGLAACSVNRIALIDAIVTSAEGVIAVIAPADAALAAPYLTAVLSITDTVSACGLTPACIATAVTDLSTLQLPVSTRIQGILSAVARAVASVIKAFPPSTVASHKLAAAKATPLSPADQAKLDTIRARIAVAEAALSKRGGRR